MKILSYCFVFGCLVKGLLTLPNLLGLRPQELPVFLFAVLSTVGFGASAVWAYRCIRRAL